MLPGDSGGSLREAFGGDENRFNSHYLEFRQVRFTSLPLEGEGLREGVV
jgi:hypothetical protein